MIDCPSLELKMKDIATVTLFSQPNALLQNVGKYINFNKEAIGLTTQRSDTTGLERGPRKESVKELRGTFHVSPFAVAYEPF